jgi:uncharacterized repeat protein (TIGR03803 family)
MRPHGRLAGHTLILLLASLTALDGCGGNGASQAPAQKYAVGGSVTGLAAGTSVVLSDNNSEALTLSADGTFVFSTAFASGSNYAITVSSQPSGQTCQVSNGSGTIGAANITNAAVSCANAYIIGGTITGLDSATGLVLANGSDTFTVPADAAGFTMPTAVANGAVFNVTVQAHPTMLNCTVTGGAGTVTGADVDSISVSCEPGTGSILYSFAGTKSDGKYPVGTLIEGRDGNFYGVTQGTANNDDNGTVFKISPGGIESVLYSFRGTDGSGPVGGLIQASDGNFYGLASGGSSLGGVFFKITPAGTETVLHTFDQRQSDGAYPVGRVLQASDGNFYGLTGNGGNYMAGTVFKITPDGTETVLYQFLANGLTDGVYPVGSLIQASDGNFYGMTQQGGDNGPQAGHGTIFRITPAGAETVLYAFKGGADGSTPSGGLIQATDGNLYGMTDSTVFKISLEGTETVVYTFKDVMADGSYPLDGGYPLGNLIQASDGNFYGATLRGGATDNGVVFKLSPGGTESVAYSFTGEPVHDTYAGSLVQARNGNIYGVTLTGGMSNLGTVFQIN